MLRYLSQVKTDSVPIQTRDKLGRGPADDRLNELDSLLTKAREHFDRSEFSESLELYKRADRLRPYHVDTLFSIARCLEEMHRPTEAMEYLEKVRNLDPDHEEASISLANHYLDAQEFAKAIAIYSRWTDSAENGPLARYNLGVAYFRK